MKIDWIEKYLMNAKKCGTGIMDKTIITGQWRKQVRPKCGGYRGRIKGPREK